MTGLLPKKFFSRPVHPKFPYAVEKYDSGGSVGGDRGQPDSDRRHWQEW